MIKKTLRNLITYWLMIFYKVVYVEDENAGYYLHKRKWVWYLCFIPILISRTIINLFLEVLNIFKEIHSYDSRWISVNDKKPEKLTFKQKKYIIERLMS